MISDDFSVQTLAIDSTKLVGKLLQTCTNTHWEHLASESYIDVVPAKLSYIHVGHRLRFGQLRWPSTPCSDLVL